MATHTIKARIMWIFRLKVNCRMKFRLAWETDGRPVPNSTPYKLLLVYNSLVSSTWSGPNHACMMYYVDFLEKFIGFNSNQNVFQHDFAFSKLSISLYVRCNVWKSNHLLNYIFLTTFFHWFDDRDVCCFSAPSVSY